MTGAIFCKFGDESQELHLLERQLGYKTKLSDGSLEITRESSRSMFGFFCWGGGHGKMDGLIICYMNKYIYNMEYMVI